MNNFERSMRFRATLRVIQEHGLCNNSRNHTAFEKLYDAGQLGNKEKVMQLVNEIKEKYPEEST